MRVGEVVIVSMIYYLLVGSVVNLSFNSASMPSSTKNAVLSPLLKKPSLDFQIFSNIRPVSCNHASDELFV